MPAVALALALLLPLARPAPVLAHEGGAPDLNIQTYQPGALLHDGLFTRSAELPSAWQGTALLALHYSRRPLRFVSTAADVEQTLVGDLWMADVGGALGLPRGFAVAAVLPVALVLRGGGADLTQVPEPQAPAFGDLRLDLRRQLLTRDLASSRVTLAAELGADLPTAAENAWLGGQLAVRLEVLATAVVGPWRADLDLGLRVTGEETLAVHPPAAPGGPHVDQVLLQSGSSAVLRAGLGRGLLADRLRVRTELQLGGQAPWVDAAPESQVQLDLAAGADYALVDALRVFAGVSGAPTTGPGSAALRVQAGLRLDFEKLPRDSDADGLDDRFDACPLQAEDRDGFDDRDGCPDPDDDLDGVPDAQDRCPRVAEDKDGFEDADGCPDLDDDRDGIPDTADACRDKAEDVDGFEDRDGCPEADNDQDGLPDLQDLCPLQPENRNGFEDEDGCPDTPPRPPEVKPAPAPVPAPAAAPPPPAPNRKATRKVKPVAP